jgi:molybdopterin-binding protein
VRPIGYVRSDYQRPEDTPLQARRNPAAPGRLVVFDEYTPGLRGLDGFDYAHLVCLLDRAWEADGRGGAPFTAERLQPVPFLLERTGERVGVFACRFPVRPNYLALSLVRITGVRADGFDFTGVDLADATPVVDVKPFVPGLDRPPPGAVRAGWYDRSGILDATTRPEEGSTMQISARNQLQGRVTSITTGEVMAEVTVDVGGNEIVSAITKSSVERLGLSEGSDVVVIIKATEVMLATG